MAWAENSYLRRGKTKSYRSIYRGPRGKEAAAARLRFALLRSRRGMKAPVKGTVKAYIAKQARSSRVGKMLARRKFAGGLGRYMSDFM